MTAARRGAGGGLMPLACPRALSCLLLLANLPTPAHGFALACHGSLCRSGTAPSSDDFTPRNGRNCATAAVWGASVPRRARASSTSSVMFMGARDGGSNEHKDQQDQREEMEDSSSGADDDLLVEVKRRDWRLFRKNLISQYGNDTAKDSWGDGCWAHEIGKVEPGCLLLATEEIWDGPFHQSVILVLSHDHDLGTVGLILNRPGTQRLQSLAGLKSDLAEVFADSLVFDGGPVGLGTMTVVHAADGAEGSETVLPGVYAGGFDSLVQLTRQGVVEKNRVRFVHGHSAWAPGQLQGELDRNQWFVAAAASELVTAGCDTASNPLWGKILRLMGGAYQEVAKRNEPMA